MRFFYSTRQVIYIFFLAVVCIIPIAIMDCSGSSKKHKSVEERLNSGAVRYSEFRDFMLVKGVSDLGDIVQALRDYEQDHFIFPKSKDDGLSWSSKLTAGEGQTSSWIPELVPEYIDNLPVDVRGNSYFYNQYIYKSNGRDYKLLSLYPVNCVEVKERFPSLIDPRRSDKCEAYGFWTYGAKNW